VWAHLFIAKEVELSMVDTSKVAVGRMNEHLSFQRHLAGKGKGAKMKRRGAAAAGGSFTCCLVQEQEKTSPGGKR
jgi:hypothetical protein